MQVVLINILLALFIVMCFQFILNLAMWLIDGRREEKRKIEREKRDEEYHAERMKNL